MELLSEPVGGPSLAKISTIPQDFWEKGHNLLLLMLIEDMYMYKAEKMLLSALSEWEMSEQICCSWSVTNSTAALILKWRTGLPWNTQS